MGFRRDACDMGRKDQVGNALEPLPRFRRHRLLGKDIERGSAEVPRPQRSAEGRFVNDPAAGRVDEHGARLHKAYGADVDHIPRLGRSAEHAG